MFSAIKNKSWITIKTLFINNESFNTKPKLQFHYLQQSLNQNFILHAILFTKYFYKVILNKMLFFRSIKKQWCYNYSLKQKLRIAWTKLLVNSCFYFTLPSSRVYWEILTSWMIVTKWRTWKKYPIFKFRIKMLDSWKLYFCHHLSNIIIVLRIKTNTEYWKIFRQYKSVHEHLRPYEPADNWRQATLADDSAPAPSKVSVSSAPSSVRKLSKFPI